MRTPLPQVRGEERLRGDTSVAERLADIFRLGEHDHQVSISGIHGLHPYPGRMHPLWARRILESTDKSAVVMDPFCGGGTVLIEARARGLQAWGSDINPVALRLARLRTSNGPNPTDLVAAAQRCADRCGKRRDTPFSQLASGETRLPRHVLAGLISLRDEIEQVDNAHIREVLLFALSPLIDKFAARADRKAPRVSKDAVPRHFLSRVERWAEVYSALPSAAFARIERADARWLPWKPDSVDVVITSPPYPGVLDYAGAQARRLQWLGSEHDLRGTVRKEIGRRSGNDNWSQSMERVFQQLVRVTSPNALIYMVVGDGVTRGEAVYTDRVLNSIVRHLPLKFVASASQIRPHFHRESSRAFAHRPRGEHLMLWRRTGPSSNDRRGSTGAHHQPDSEPRPRSQDGQRRFPPRGPGGPDKRRHGGNNRHNHRGRPNRGNQRPGSRPGPRKPR